MNGYTPAMTLSMMRAAAAVTVLTLATTVSATPLASQHLRSQSAETAAVGLEQALSPSRGGLEETQKRLIEITRQIAVGTDSGSSEIGATPEQVEQGREGWQLIGQLIPTTNPSPHPLTREEANPIADFLIAVARRGDDFWQRTWGPDRTAERTVDPIHERLAAAIRVSSPEVAALFVPLSDFRKRLGEVANRIVNPESPPAKSSETTTAGMEERPTAEQIEAALRGMQQVFVGAERSREVQIFSRNAVEWFPWLTGLLRVPEIAGRVMVEPEEEGPVPLIETLAQLEAKSVCYYGTPTEFRQFSKSATSTRISTTYVPISKPTETFSTETFLIREFLKSLGIRDWGLPDVRQIKNDLAVLTAA